MSSRVEDIDKKIVIISEKLNLMVDNQSKLTELHNKYNSIESKLDQIMVRLDSPPVSCQSDGAQTYLVGPDRSGRKMNMNMKILFIIQGLMS